MPLLSKRPWLPDRRAKTRPALDASLRRGRLDLSLLQPWVPPHVGWWRPALSAAERRLDLAGRLAAGIADPRDPARVWHPLADILRARMLAIACGYEDADDLDRLRTDPGLKLACGRLPDTGRDLPSQPAVSRWENAPTLREVIGLMRTMVDVHCASYARPPVAVTLDIDDTCDVVHGHQQLSLFSGHYGERCFLPIHVYDVETSRRPCCTDPLAGALLVGWPHQVARPCSQRS